MNSMVEFPFFNSAFITRRIANFLFINCNQKDTKNIIYSGHASTPIQQFQIFSQFSQLQ